MIRVICRLHALHSTLLTGTAVLLGEFMQQLIVCQVPRAGSARTQHVEQDMLLDHANSKAPELLGGCCMLVASSLAVRSKPHSLFSTPQAKAQSQDTKGCTCSAHSACALSMSSRSYSQRL